MTAQPYMYIDAPVAGANPVQAFTLAGWAIDIGAGSGTGVDGVQLYAYPPIGNLTFLGAATYGLSRPDVAAIYGVQFQNCGWTFSVTGLQIGAYALVAFAHSTVVSGYNNRAEVDVNVTVDRPAPITIASPLRQWKLYRCDLKPRLEQTA